MSGRIASWLAWSACALSLALTALSLLLLTLSVVQPDVPIDYYWLETSVIAVGYSAVGAIVASRLPDSPIGWLFCAIGLSFGVVHFSAEYAIYALLASPRSLPGGEASVWIWSWVWVPAIGFVVFLDLLFPDGRLPSTRWRWFARFNIAAVVVGALLAAFSPGPILELPIRNPLGIEGLPNVYRTVEAFMYALVVVGASSMLLRLRRVGWIQRQQIKWFAYSTAVAISGIILKNTAFPLAGEALVWWVGLVLTVVGLAGIPIGMGIAILRYRLYNIDLIINRTLVYGLLTAMLVALYFGGIVVLQSLFVILIGEKSTLAVVASTLLIAALFNPFRRRIQAAVDRRFYRRKYDARTTLEAFSAHLRNQTDLQTLSEDLAGVVAETMQPAHVSVWLRPESTSKGEQAG
jgi:cytochrome b subunit of formate dehydrogenase